MNKQQKAVQQTFLDNEKKVLKKLEENYQDALFEINDKIDHLLARDDADMQNVIYQVDYQKALKAQVQGILDQLHANEFDTVSEYLAASYTDGFVGTMYDMHGQGIPLIIPIDQEQVVAAIQHETKLSDTLYAVLGKDTKQLSKQIAGEISRGISNAATYNEIARNIANYSNIPRNNAARIARTEAHRIQNRATANAQIKAKSKGADVLKQWDSFLDGRTRPSHRKIDGQIKELEEPFEVDGKKAMQPGDFGDPADDCNCRCALLQRARWALGEEELEILKKRAEYFGLDKSDSFEDFKKKYLKASEVAVPTPKKEYLTEKKLKEKLSQADIDLDDLKNQYSALENSSVDFDSIVKMEELQKKIDEIELQKIDWQAKLDKKLATKEIKSLTKEQIALQKDLDAFNDELSKKVIKTYSGIWKDDVTTADYASKMGSIDAKKKYFENKIINAADIDEVNKWKNYIDQLGEFEKEGAEYYSIQQKIKKAEQTFNKNKQNIDSIKKNGFIPAKVDAFTQERKDAAYWFTDQNGGTKAADAVLRKTCGEVWKDASNDERHAIYEYTSSYHKYNEPLRGIEYGTNKYLGVGNVDLDEIGVKYGGFKKGAVKKLIDDMTSIIEKSSYQDDFWVQRGCNYGGMDKFFGIDPSDFNLPENQLASKLLGTEPTEYGFLSTGVSKGKGFSNMPIIMNIYAPSGTKMMYAEPFSAFGNGDGRKWDGISQQTSFGSEAEMIFQRGTTFRVTKVEKSGSKIYIDLDVIGQEQY